MTMETDAMGEPDPHDRSALATIIKTRLLGVDPDNRDVELEDADWRLVIDALEEGAVIHWCACGRRYVP